MVKPERDLDGLPRIVVNDRNFRMLHRELRMRGEAQTLKGLPMVRHAHAWNGPDVSSVCVD